MSHVPMITLPKIGHHPFVATCSYLISSRPRVLLCFKNNLIIKEAPRACVLSSPPADSVLWYVDAHSYLPDLPQSEQRQL